METPTVYCHQTAGLICRQQDPYLSCQSSRHVSTGTCQGKLTQYFIQRLAQSLSLLGFSLHVNAGVYA